MRHQSGFSLLELAIAIVILAAILGSVVVPVATQMQAKKIKETEQLLDDAKEALMGFALSNGRLPCPDNDATAPNPDGIEDSPCLVGGAGGGAPSPVEGFLPWNTLGMNAVDSWGRTFHYSVVDEFTIQNNPSPPLPNPACFNNDDDFDLCDNGTSGTYITVRGLAGSLNLANNVPAIVISHGPNGWGGTELSGNVIPTPPNFGADENDNLLDPPPSSGQFVLRTYLADASATCNDAGTPLCNFDDLVVWLSTPILFNRMVAAGRLP